MRYDNSLTLETLRAAMRDAAAALALDGYKVLTRDLTSNWSVEMVSPSGIRVEMSAHSGRGISVHKGYGRETPPGKMDTVVARVRAFVKAHEQGNARREALHAKRQAEEAVEAALVAKLVAASGMSADHWEVEADADKGAIATRASLRVTLTEAEALAVAGFIRELRTERVITMLHGHVVNAEVVRREADDKIVCRFLSHRKSGAPRLCLDLGQSWYIQRGEEFTCTQGAINHAAELAKKGF